MSVIKDNEGVKYFIYLISQKRIIPYIDTDIRMIIWDYATNPYLILNLGNNITLKLIIYI